MVPTLPTMDYKNHHALAGDFNNPHLDKTRIVHISDTHQKHMVLLADDMIPEGDILVHSGDFNTYHRNQPKHSERDFIKLVGQLNAFFDLLPHKHKIFVPGNHDINLDDKSSENIQNLLPSCIYLQDTSCYIDGLKFYGSGWTLVRECSSARSFAVKPDEITKHWDKIPVDTDILVTHSPPYAILDGSDCRRQDYVTSCKSKQDCGHGHIGCPQLRRVVLNKIKPKVHLFGHNHGGNHAMVHKGIVFSNAAMSYIPVPTVIDYYRAPGTDKTKAVPAKDILFHRPVT